MSISFKQYLVEEEKTIFFSWGRMNPPTIGHGKLLDKLASIAGKNPYRMYLSQSTDAKNNPLAYKEKIKTVRKMFPKHARAVMENKKIKTVFDLVQQLYDDGFRKVVMVVGSDRIREFDILLNKYNGKKGTHGLYNFASIKIISAGDRDPDAEGVDGMSASKMRVAAQENDFPSFAGGLPKQYSNADSKRLFNSVRKGMDLKEAVDFHKHVQLKTVSATREAFVSGDLINVGDEVILKETDQLCVVTRLGANYIIVESDGKQYRKWLDAVELVTEKAAQDPDIKDRKGTQPKAYHTGLKTTTKTKRDAHFKKQSKKSDDDSSAYKPAPGDKGAKTQQSVWTKRFSQMYDEEATPVDVAKERIAADKKSAEKRSNTMAVRHDRILDRARLSLAKNKNKETKPND
tara:strand:+ start:3247 stop:4455 length:1209 start_codon:yes stop_codon:yes gene_type:complete